MKKITGAFLLLILGCTTLTAQSPAAVSDETIRKNIFQYTLDAGDHAAIYQGVGEPPLRGNLPSIYLRERGYKRLDSWGDEITPLPQNAALSYGIGTVVYDGMTHEQVPLRLDLYRDHLAVMTPNKEFFVLLDPAKLSHAEFFGYRVYYLDGTVYGLPAGYYLEMHTGIIPVLKKESFEFNVINQEFVNWSRKYYILKDGIALQVRNKSTIQKALGLNSRELSDFINTYQLDLKNNFETDLLRIVNWVEASNR